MSRCQRHTLRSRTNVSQVHAPSTIIKHIEGHHPRLSESRERAVGDYLECPMCTFIVVVSTTNEPQQVIGKHVRWAHRDALQDKPRKTTWCEFAETKSQEMFVKAICDDPKCPYAQQVSHYRAPSAQSLSMPLSTTAQVDASVGTTLAQKVKHMRSEHPVQRAARRCEACSAVRVFACLQVSRIWSRISR